MKLSETQIKELLQKPRLSLEIQKGRRYESRLRIFTESKFKEDIEKEQAWKEYLGYMENALDKQRFDRICSFIMYPLPVVDITKSNLSELYKVFDSKNAYFHFEAENQNLDRVLRSTVQKMNVVDWITRNGKKVIKNKPNSIVVIDKNDKGEPYLLLVDNDRLIDCFVLENGQLEYVAFHHSTVESESGEREVRVSVYDDEFYRVFLKTKEGSFVLDSEEAHSAGITPAKMFIDNKMNEDDCFNRKSPLTNSVSKLQEWSQFDTYKVYTDHYGPFPVTEIPESDCGVEGCESGVVYEDEGYIIHQGTKFEEKTTRKKYYPCPSCSTKKALGPGTVITIPSITDKNVPSPSGQFKFISPDITSLNYLKDKLNYIEQEIKSRVVGIDSMIENQAINKDQVNGSFQSRQNVLIELKKSFDELYTWVIQTTAKIVVEGAVVAAHGNFGTEYYLVSYEDWQKRYEKAKTTGMPESELDMIYRQMVETKYKGNPSKLTRMEIMRLIDPLPHCSYEQAVSRQEKGVIRIDDLLLKGRFISFVDRFELEQAPLVEFGKHLEMKVRINKIKEILNKYTDEAKKESAGNGYSEPTATS